MWKAIFLVMRENDELQLDPCRLGVRMMSIS